MFIASSVSVSCSSAVFTAAVLLLLHCARAAAVEVWKPVSVDIFSFTNGLWGKYLHTKYTDGAGGIFLHQDRYYLVRQKLKSRVPVF